MEKKIFSFLFNTVFYSGIPKETIRMPFRGLTMLKSRKLVIKGGLCYRFAMVPTAPSSPLLRSRTAARLKKKFQCAPYSVTWLW